MSVLVDVDAIFSGFKTGNKKDSHEQWIALQFTAPEVFKGNVIQASMLNQPNILTFPKEGDYTDLKIGSTYSLRLAVSGRKNSSYPTFELLELKLKNQYASTT